MAKITSPDRAYLIRCWQEHHARPEAPQWRFSAEEVLHERKGRGFADLVSLLDYLRTELGSESEEEPSYDNVDQGNEDGTAHYSRRDTRLPQVCCISVLYKEVVHISRSLFSGHHDRL